MPDNILQMHSHNNTVASLLSQMTQPPKPKTLYEALNTERQDLIGLPNVQINPRRETPVDKEKNVGRWKVIEKQLRYKGLPVLGST